MKCHNLFFVSQTNKYANVESQHRSSCSRMFFKVDVLKNSAIFIGKH